MECHLNDAIISTQLHCAHLEEEIRKRQKVLLDLKETTSPPDDIQSFKLRKLKAELEFREQGESTPPLHHPLAVCARLNEETDLLIDQTEKLIQICRVRCASLGKTIDDKENLVLEQIKLHDAILQRLEQQPDAISEQDQEEFVNEYNSELEMKRNAVEKRRQELKQVMKLFVHKHFPPAVGESRSVISLHQLIDDLITLKINNSESPYLAHGSQHHPHVELLLSSGLAVRHPSDIHRIKLLDLEL